MDTQFQPQVPMNAGSSSSKMKWIVIGIVALVLIIAVAWYFMGSKGKVLGASTSENYQALFLTNGQVYFGKISNKGDWIELSDIYYLQLSQNLQAAATSDETKNATPTTGDNSQQNQNIQLVKLGSELHGPKDVMHIERDKVMFWEDMKNDSKVVQAINQYKSK